jgi:WD40 repeat protein
VSASDGCLVQWNTDTGKLTDHVEGHPEAIRSLAFSAASPYLASGSRDGEVRIWDRNRLKTGPEFIRQAETPQNLRWLVFSADGRWLAGGGEAHSIPWWDLQSRTQLSDVKTGSEQLRRVFFTANGRRMLVTGGGKLSICNLDQPGRGETLLTLTERDLPLEDVAVNRDGTLIADVDKDGTVTLLDIRLDRLLALWRTEAARDEAPSPPNDD